MEERSQEQPMKMESNKAFHRTAHKAPPVNADVGIRINGLPHVKWTLHHPLAKSIDDATTISDMARA